MKILVTGAAGFIGSKTAEFLLKDKNQVIGIDDLNDSCDPKLKKHRLKGLEGARFKFHRCDIRDLRSLAKIFKTSKAQAVAHLAARAGVRSSLENPFIYESTNIAGTLNVLELCKDNGIPKLVFASTSSLYAGAPAPFRESARLNAPISPYAATKMAAETLCGTYHYLYGTDITVLRYFTVYGPAGRPDMSYFKFIRCIREGRLIEIYGDGKQQRDFTYIDDIARGTVAALHSRTGFKVINLGGGKRYPLMDLVREIEKCLGKKARVQYFSANKIDMVSTWANNSLAQEILHWQPRVSLEEGIDKTVQWHQKNSSLLKSISF